MQKYVQAVLCAEDALGCGINAVLILNDCVEESLMLLRAQSEPWASRMAARRHCHTALMRQRHLGHCLLWGGNIKSESE